MHPEHIFKQLINKTFRKYRMWCIISHPPLFLMTIVYESKSQRSCHFTYELQVLSVMILKN